MSAQPRLDCSCWPADTLLLILSQLEAQEVVQAGLVNKHWAGVALSSRAWSWRLQATLPKESTAALAAECPGPRLWQCLKPANLLLPLDCRDPQQPAPGFALCKAPLKAWTALPTSRKGRDMQGVLTKVLLSYCQIPPTAVQPSRSHEGCRAETSDWFPDQAFGDWLREYPAAGVPSNDTLPQPLAAFAEQPEQQLIALASSSKPSSMCQVIDLVSELTKRGLTSQQACTCLDTGPPITLMVWLGSRSDCQGQGRVTLLLCKDYADLDTVLTWSYKMAHKSGQELQQDDPSSWDLSMPATGPDQQSSSSLGDASYYVQHYSHKRNLDETIIRVGESQGQLHKLVKLGERELGPDMAALWTSGIVRPPLGEWQAVQGGVSGYTPGMRWAHVALRGCDVGREGWREGHYGCKFAGPQLTFGSIDSFEA